MTGWEWFGLFVFGIILMLLFFAAYCKEQTIAKRLLGFYVGSTEQVKLWECRSCLGIWSEKTN